MKCKHCNTTHDKCACCPAGIHADKIRQYEALCERILDRYGQAFDGHVFIGMDAAVDLFCGEIKALRHERDCARAILNDHGPDGHNVTNGQYVSALHSIDGLLERANRMEQERDAAQQEAREWREKAEAGSRVPVGDIAEYWHERWRMESGRAERMEAERDALAWEKMRDR